MAWVRRDVEGIIRRQQHLCRLPLAGAGAKLKLLERLELHRAGGGLQVHLPLAARPVQAQHLRRGAESCGCGLRVLPVALSASIAPAFLIERPQRERKAGTGG